MIQKKTIVDQIEITSHGVVQVRLALLVVEGENIIAKDYHRTVIEPGISPDDQFALVNQHLVSMNKEPVSDSEMIAVRAHAQVAHTPEVVEAFRAGRRGYSIVPPN